MLAILSPAKRFNEKVLEPEWVEKSEPLFGEKTAELVGKLQGYDKEGLSKLMGVSEKLSSLNVDRYSRFWDQEKRAALYFFGGDTYVGFDAKSLDREGFYRAQGCVRILSGLYGVLRPCDEMRAYRLEMGTKWGEGGLYSFWREEVTNCLCEEGGDCVVNLASGEYASVVDVERLRERGVLWLNFVFYDEVLGGGMKVVGLWSKRARGMYARAIVDGGIEKREDLEMLKERSVGGYRFAREESGEGRWVFKRRKLERAA